MSFVGKLLVVLQVVLSVCFMAFAGAVFATHTNWKQENAATQAKLDSKTSQMNTLQNRFEQLDAETEKLTVVAEVQNLTNENNQYKSRQNDHENHANVAQEQTRIALKHAENRTNEAVTLRKENKQITDSRHEELKERLRLEVALKAEQEKTALLNETLKDQLRDIAQLKSALRRAGLSDTPGPIAQASPQDVDGRVKRVKKNRRGTVDLVEVNIGSDDGLIKGHTLTVYRGGKYLGELRIVETSTDMAVALGDAFDVSPDFFANLQTLYDLQRAKRPDAGVRIRANWVSAFPVREMIRRG